MALASNASMPELPGSVSLSAGLTLLSIVVLARVMFICLGKPRAMVAALRSIAERVRGTVACLVCASSVATASLPAAPRRLGSFC